MSQKERRQRSIFGDNWIYKITLEKFPDHPLVKLKPLVNKILESVERNREACYSKDFGRASYLPFKDVTFKRIL